MRFLRTINNKNNFPYSFDFVVSGVKKEEAFGLVTTNARMYVCKTIPPGALWMAFALFIEMFAAFWRRPRLQFPVQRSAPRVERCRRLEGDWS